MKICTTLLLAGTALTAAQQHDYTPKFVFIESNYDFTGKDIGNAPAARPEDCLKPSLSFWNTYHNVAFSWNNYNNGTCWIKESKGQAVYKPGVSSSRLYYSNPEVCTLHDGIDFVDNDLSSLSGLTATQCCEKCQRIDKCRVYTWNDYMGGTCWFKTRRGQAITKPGVKAGFAYPDLDPIFPRYIDTDFVGHDIGKQNGKLEDCEAACFKFAGCRAFTWTNYNGGTCWFKAKKEKTVPKAGAVSFNIDKYSMLVFEEDNMDYVGRDIGNVPGIAEAEDCVQICQDTKDCSVVSWSNYRGGTCWLKFVKPEAPVKFTAPGVKTFWV